MPAIDTTVRKYGHLLGLSGSINAAGTSYNLEKSIAKESMPWLKQTIDLYIKNIKTTEHLKIIQQTVDQAEKILVKTRTNATKELYHRYSTNQPIMIYSGWSGHAVALVLYKNKLIITNRGSGGEKNYGTHICDLKENLDPNIIKKFINSVYQAGYQAPETQLKNSQDLQNQINTVIRHGSDQKLKLTASKQKHATCGYVNFMRSIEGMLLILDQETGKYLLDESKASANSAYKQISYFRRDNAVQELISFAQKSSPKEQEIYYQLMLTAIIQHHDKNKQLGGEYKRAQQLFSALPVKYKNQLAKQNLDITCQIAPNFAANYIKTSGTVLTADKKKQLVAAQLKSIEADHKTNIKHLDILLNIITDLGDLQQEKTIKNLSYKEAKYLHGFIKKLSPEEFNNLLPNASKNSSQKDLLQTIEVIKKQYIALRDQHKSPPKIQPQPQIQTQHTSKQLSFQSKPQLAKPQIVTPSTIAGNNWTDFIKILTDLYNNITAYFTDPPRNTIDIKVQNNLAAKIHRSKHETVFTPVANKSGHISSDTHHLITKACVKYSELQLNNKHKTKPNFILKIDQLVTNPKKIEPLAKKIFDLYLAAIDKGLKLKLNPYAQDVINKSSLQQRFVELQTEHKISDN